MSETDPEYVHMQFHDPDRLDAIRDAKEDHNVRWREMVEFGKRYLETIDEIIEDNPKLVAQHMLERTDTDELLEHTEIDDLVDRIDSPKRDPDTLGPE